MHGNLDLFVPLLAFLHRSACFVVFSFQLFPCALESFHLLLLCRFPRAIFLFALEHLALFDQLALLLKILHLGLFLGNAVLHASIQVCRLSAHHCFGQLMRFFSLRFAFGRFLLLLCFRSFTLLVAIGSFRSLSVVIIIDGVFVGRVACSLFRLGICFTHHNIVFFLLFSFQWQTRFEFLQLLCVLGLIFPRIPR